MKSCSEGFLTQLDDIKLSNLRPMEDSRLALCLPIYLVIGGGKAWIRVTLIVTFSFVYFFLPHSLCSWGFGLSIASVIWGGEERRIFWRDSDFLFPALFELSRIKSDNLREFFYRLILIFFFFHFRDGTEKPYAWFNLGTLLENGWSEMV